MARSSDPAAERHCSRAFCGRQPSRPPRASCSSIAMSARRPSAGRTCTRVRPPSPADCARGACARATPSPSWFPPGRPSSTRSSARRSPVPCRFPCTRRCGWGGSTNTTRARPPCSTRRARPPRAHRAADAPARSDDVVARARARARLRRRRAKCRGRPFVHAARSPRPRDGAVLLGHRRRSQAGRAHSRQRARQRRRHARRGSSRPAPTSVAHGVSWLPLYHDMGLIGCVFLALYHPGSLTLIPPELFVARPALWLRALSRTRAALRARRPTSPTRSAPRAHPGRGDGGRGSAAAGASRSTAPSRCRPRRLQEVRHAVRALGAASRGAHARLRSRRGHARRHVLRLADGPSARAFRSRRARRRNVSCRRTTAWSSSAWGDRFLAWRSRCRPTPSARFGCGDLR